MNQRLALHVLASGSRGNAAVVEDTATGKGVLVDCGICKRDFFARCDEAGFDPANLEAVLITHDHTDHTKGLGVVLRGLAKLGIEPAVFADDAVRAASKEIIVLEGACDLRAFSSGDALSLAGMQVHAFRTSHDAASSCGFRVEADGDAVGFMTDTGIVTGEADEALRDVRILALESNHDVQMLKDGPYPYPVKRRVGSDTGHLSNVQAAAYLAEQQHVPSARRGADRRGSTRRTSGNGAGRVSDHAGERALRRAPLRMTGDPVPEPALHDPLHAGDLREIDDRGYDLDGDDREHAGRADLLEGVQRERRQRREHGERLEGAQSRFPVDGRIALVALLDDLLRRGLVGQREGAANEQRGRASGEAPHALRGDGQDRGDPAEVESQRDGDDRAGDSDGQREDSGLPIHGLPPGR